VGDAKMSMVGRLLMQGGIPAVVLSKFPPTTQQSPKADERRVSAIERNDLVASPKNCS
jgi:hypothetical protein